MLNKMLSSNAVYDFQEPWSTMKKTGVPPYVILRSEGGGVEKGPKIAVILKVWPLM